MSFFRLHRTFTTWLAMWAMVLGALMPTMAQAMVAATDRGQWVEVCSASGMVWLKADAASATDEIPAEPVQSMADMGKHCLWCAFHGSMVGLLPVELPALPSVTAAKALPEATNRVVISRVPYGAQARAPPFAS
jgi:hypothetical protein